MKDWPPVVLALGCIAAACFLLWLLMAYGEHP